MPIYEFICQACGHEFEQIVSFSATKSPSCPACHSEQVQRQLSRPAIHFKGSGWYITDSKASPTAANGKTGEKAEAAESPSAEKADAPAKTEPKSETKSEPKSETKAASTTN